MYVHWSVFGKLTEHNLTASVDKKKIQKNQNPLCDFVVIKDDPSVNAYMDTFINGRMW